MNFLNKNIINELEKYGEVNKDVDLKKYNTFKISSICDYLVIPRNKESLKNLIKYLKTIKKEFIILGNGSNVIFKNKRTKKVVILLTNLNKISYDQNIVTAESGVKLPILVNDTLNKDLLGLEWAINIPGTVGGSVFGNAGCYGNEINERLISVEVLKDNEFKVLNKNELYFSYRDSIFKKEKNMIIISASFMLEYGSSESVKEVIKERNIKRKETQPLEYPSAGSVFRNPLGDYAGAIVEKLGFKKFSINDAEVSEKHANFIINKGNATGKDVIKLIKKIQKKAKQEYNIDLILEHIIID